MIVVLGKYYALLVNQFQQNGDVVIGKERRLFFAEKQVWETIFGTITIDGKKRDWCCQYNELLPLTDDEKERSAK